ncbi:MAG: hypothetical protein ICV84_19925, partial [Flavisolibacter sp.]|nr:hypothetical protein [Flavisolibacter sp.]
MKGPIDAQLQTFENAFEGSEAVSGKNIKKAEKPSEGKVFHRLLLFCEERGLPMTSEEPTPPAKGKKKATKSKTQNKPKDY